MFTLPSVITTAAVALALFLPSPAAAQEAVAPTPLPGGVADPAGKVGFLSGVKGLVEAVDLEKGDLLWQSKEPARPLVAFDRYVAAQATVEGKANRVRVVVLDAKDGGKKVLESEPVVFPEWVSVSTTYGRTFSSHAAVRKGELLLHWQANAFYAGGAPPPPEVIQAAQKEASGVAKVDLKSGKVTLADAEKTPTGPDARLPEELKKVASQQYWTGRDWKTTPFVIGNTVSALSSQDVGGGAAQLSLKRWDLKTGKSLDTVQLLRGKSLWPQVAADGKFVLVHQGLVKEQLPPGDYAWWVFSLETGAQVSKFPFEGTLAEATVLGGRLYHLGGGQGRPGFGMGERVQPRSIKAVDLKTGKMLWERPIEGQRILPPLP